MTCPELRETATRIFGENAVREVWVARDEHKYLGAAVNNLGLEALSIQLPTYGEVIIQFTNGRTVSFGTTEGARISLVEGFMLEVVAPNPAN